MPSRDRFELHIGEDSSPEHARADAGAFEFAVLGDFSAGGQRTAVAERKPLLVDRDNLDAVVSRMRSALDTPAGPLQVLSIDDLHPDRIYAQCSGFGRLRDLRRRLSDPATFAGAVQDLTGQQPPAPQRIEGASVLEQMLGGTGAAPRRARPKDDLQEFIERSVEPYATAGEHPQTPEWIANVDAASSVLMRAVLRDPDFSALECLWRSVAALVRRVETGVDLKIRLYDVRSGELASPEFAAMLFRSPAPAVILSAFPVEVADLPSIQPLLARCRQTNSVWLAEAGTSLFGSAEWQALRGLDVARSLGLALPRVLVRMPYGAASEPCEAFRFEELDGPPSPELLPFANPAFVLGVLLGQGFEAGGWSAPPGAVREFADVPVVSWKGETETEALPPVEIVLDEGTAESLLDSGIMPLVWPRGSDAVRVLRFQSAAEPLAPLAGRWNAA